MQFQNQATRLPALALLERLGARLGHVQTRQLLLKPIVTIFEVRRTRSICAPVCLRPRQPVSLPRRGGGWAHDGTDARSPFCALADAAGRQNPTVESYRYLLRRGVLHQLQGRLAARDVLRQLVPFVIESLFATETVEPGATEAPIPAAPLPRPPSPLPTGGASVNSSTAGTLLAVPTSEERRLPALASAVLLGIAYVGTARRVQYGESGVQLTVR